MRFEGLTVSMLLMRAFASIVTVSHSGDGYYIQTTHCLLPVHQILQTTNLHTSIFQYFQKVTYISHVWLLLLKLVTWNLQPINYCSWASNVNFNHEPYNGCKHTGWEHIVKFSDVPILFSAAQTRWQSIQLTPTFQNLVTSSLIHILKFNGNPPRAFWITLLTNNTDKQMMVSTLTHQSTAEVVTVSVIYRTVTISGQYFTKTKC